MIVVDTRLFDNLGLMNLGQSAVFILSRLNVVVERLDAFVVLDKSYDVVVVKFQCWIQWDNIGMFT